MGSSFIISCQEAKERVNHLITFLMFFAKVSNPILKSNHHHQSKHPIKGDGSFLPLVSSSWIWLYSKCHLTTNDPWIGLKCKY